AKCIMHGLRCCRRSVCRIGFGKGTTFAKGTSFGTGTSSGVPIRLSLSLPLANFGSRGIAFGQMTLAFATLICLSTVALAQQIHFRDITEQAGIHFVHNNGAFGKKYLPETMGPGCAFIDYDNDGYPDIVLVNGENWPGHPGAPSTLKLYHNNHNRTFTDVTRKAGLAVPMFGLGVAVGDYDNDGFDDLFIIALGQRHLFHKTRNATFTDVTKAVGLWGPNEFSTGAAWVDYDRDGKLDLVVANYVQWSIQGDLFCTLDGTRKS